MRLIFPASMPLNDRLTYESFNILSFTINGFSVTCSSTNNAVEEQSPDISRKDTDLRLFRGHQHSSVLVYPKIKETLYMKKGRSETPCSCALNLLSLELSDSAAALVDLLIK